MPCVKTSQPIDADSRDRGGPAFSSGCGTEGDPVGDFTGGDGDGIEHLGGGVGSPREGDLDLDGHLPDVFDLHLRPEDVPATEATLTIHAAECGG